MAKNDNKDIKKAESSVATVNVDPVNPIESPEVELELNPEELAAESARVAALMAEKKEKIPAKMYSEEAVNQIVNDILKQKGLVARDETDEDKPAQPVCRLSRFQGKFIVDIKDMNTDPYVKTKVEAFDLFNEQTRTFEPWVTLMFDDGTDMTVRLWQAVKGSRPIQVTILETTKEDTSYNVMGPDGKAKKIERSDVKWDQYKSVGSGVTVTQRIKQFDSKYKVQLPDGRILTVGSNVINWS